MKKKYDIFIRPINEKDITEDYLSWINDKQVNQYLETRFNQVSIDELSNYVSEILKDENVYFFAICLNVSNEHIGNIKIGPINKIHKRGEIGLMIGNKNYWGKGYGKQSIDLVCKFAFKELKLNKITAGCYSTNIASKNAFLKNAFVIEGVFEHHFIDSNGKWVDLISLSKFNGTFN